MLSRRGHRALWNLSFRSMGCQVGLWLYAGHPEGRRALLAAWAQFLVVEGALSRFRDESELSRLNRSGGRPVRVSPLVWSALGEALAMARETGGLYDPTVLPALVAAGYDRPFERMEGDSPPAPLRRWRGGAWARIRLDPVRRAVTLPRGCQVDLGGIAKGWTADRVAHRLGALGPALVDAGGDIAVRGRPPGLPGWPVGVADPFCPERDLAVLRLRWGGVATSGTDFRRWRRGGRLQHHLIDPRTGRPASSGLRSARVAPSATLAEVYAKAAFLLGPQTGAQLLEARGLAGILVGEDGGVVVTPGLRRFLWPGTETEVRAGENNGRGEDGTGGASPC